MSNLYAFCLQLITGKEKNNWFYFDVWESMSQKAGESMKICLFNQVECLELEALLREEIKRSNVAFQQSLNHVVLERNIQEKY